MPATPINGRRVWAEMLIAQIIVANRKRNVIHFIASFFCSEVHISLMPERTATGIFAQEIQPKKNLGLARLAREKRLAIILANSSRPSPFVNGDGSPRHKIAKNRRGAPSPWLFASPRIATRKFTGSRIVCRNGIKDWNFSANFATSSGTINSYRPFKYACGFSGFSGLRPCRRFLSPIIPRKRAAIGGEGLQVIDVTGYYAAG